MTVSHSPTIHYPFSVEGSRIRLRHLGGGHLRETLRFTGKILSATISRVANRWFVGIAGDTQDNPPLSKAENQGVVGVDLGISARATLSTGESVAGLKSHRLTRRFCADCSGFRVA